MKVCFVTEDFYPSIIGGQGIIGKNVVEGLLSKNVQASVLAENRKGRKDYWSSFKNINLVLVPFCFGNQLILAFLEYAYFLIYSRSTYFDVVHANQLSGLFFTLLKPKNVSKVCLYVHNTNADFYYSTSSIWKKIIYRLLMVLEKYMYGHADGLVFNTESERQLLNKYYKVDHLPYCVPPLGVQAQKNLNTRRMKARKSIEKELKIKNKRIILYVGRLVKRKNVDLLIRAINSLQDKKQNTVGLIVGDGPEKKHLKDLSPKGVFFVGFHKNLENYYLSSDIFATFSVAEGGTILTALEAASFGLPLVLSKESADKNIIKNGLNGYIVSTKNVNEIEKSIINALKQGKKFGNNSLKFAQKISWKKTTAKILNFYQLMQKV